MNGGNRLQDAARPASTSSSSTDLEAEYQRRKTMALKKEVNSLWTTIDDTERGQDELAVETMRIRERLHGLVRSHEAMFDQEKDTRRLMRFQFKELHKIIAQSFERIMALAAETYQTKVELKSALEEGRNQQTQLMGELRGALEREQLRSMHLEREVQLLRGELGETKARVDGVDYRIKQAVDMAFIGMKERMDYVQSNLSSALAMQNANIQQLQTTFRDSIASAQQIEESHHTNLEMSFKSRVEPLHERLESTSQSMARTIAALEDKAAVLEGKLKETQSALLHEVHHSRGDIDARLEDVSRNLKHLMRAQEKQQSESHMVSEDLVAAVSSIKDTIQLLSKDQARSRKEMEGHWLKQLMEVRRDVQLDIERKIKRTQRDNVFVL